MTVKNDKLTCIDLFAGAGGLSEGLEQAGFHSLFASEIVPRYAETYAKNHPNAEVCVADIRTVNPKEIRERLDLEVGQLDLLAGGPPCQGFSINAPVRSSDDPRNHLFREYLRFVDEFKPRAVLIENVPGLVSFEKGKTLHAILDSLADLGYGADVHILGAPYYGVPQMRWRTIIMGLRGAIIPQSAWPEPVRHAPVRANFATTFDGRPIVKKPSPETSAPFTTVRDAIGDLPPLKSGGRGETVKEYPVAPQCEYQANLRIGSAGVMNHEAPRLSAINLERLSHIKQGGNWTDIPYDLLPKGMKSARRSDHTKRYGRPRWDELGSTVLTKCDPHWGAFFHPEQDRTLTVREAARIQSFPDHYVFLGSQAEQYAEVGNAVPPMLACAVGRSLRAVLEGE
ncbi:DNA cytosine methyltransferase [Collinsella vaginalis]|uniref:DNA cytosine methyltransferase n=1 Tax=Collinsella vaginalis TaxID=1870987 RepID=UPI001C4EF9EE|nr:DNA cytosine methyltransferase [Collinsella vaginalis]